MSSTYQSTGEIVECVAPSGGVVVGMAYLIGSLLVVAMTAAEETDIFQAKPAGVFTLPRTTGSSTGWSAGQILYWDSSAKKIVKAKSATARRVGWAPVAAGDDDTTCTVRLSGTPSVANVD